MFRLLFLPFTLTFWLIFGLLALPFLILRVALRLIGALILLPIMFVIALIGLLLGGLAFSLVVLVPVAFAVFCVWALMRLASPRPI